MTDYKEADDIG